MSQDHSTAIMENYVSISPPSALPKDLQRHMQKGGTNKLPPIQHSSLAVSDAALKAFSMRGHPLPSIGEQFPKMEKIKDMEDRMLASQVLLNISSSHRPVEHVRPHVAPRSPTSTFTPINQPDNASSTVSNFGHGMHLDHRTLDSQDMTPSHGDQVTGTAVASDGRPSALTCVKHNLHSADEAPTPPNHERRRRHVKTNAKKTKNVLGPRPLERWKEWNPALEKSENELDKKGSDSIERYEKMGVEEKVAFMDGLSTEIVRNACICQSAWRLTKSECYALPPVPQGVTMIKNDEQMFGSPGPFRRAVSHFFGRNMTSTKKLNLPILTRTCYQKSKYREDKYPDFIYRLLQLVLAINDMDFHSEVTYKVDLVKEDRNWFQAWSEKSEGKEDAEAKKDGEQKKHDGPRHGGPTAQLFKYMQETYIKPPVPRVMNKLECFKMIEDIKEKIKDSIYFADDEVRREVEKKQEAEMQLKKTEGTGPTDSAEKQVEQVDPTKPEGNPTDKKKTSRMHKGKVELASLTSKEAAKYIEGYFTFLLIPVIPDGATAAEPRPTKIPDEIYTAMYVEHSKRNPKIKSEPASSEQPEEQLPARRSNKRKRANEAKHTEAGLDDSNSNPENEDDLPVLPKRRKIAAAQKPRRRAPASKTLSRSRRNLPLKVDMATDAMEDTLPSSSSSSSSPPPSTSLKSLFFQPPIHKHMLDIPNIRMQQHRRNRIPPPDKIRAPRIKHHHIRFRPGHKHPDITPTQRQPAIPRRQQKRLGRRSSGFVVGNEPVLQRLAVPDKAGFLQPQAGAWVRTSAEKVKWVSAPRADRSWKRCAVGWFVAVVHFAFGGDGGVLVGLAQEAGVEGVEVGGVAGDDGEGGVEQGVRVEERWGVCGAPGAG
ncbi:hypothetical protein EJ05DRAFT_529557 [Pseudovirgaria hyperparasitica]|uniref:Uncharacterized protein n=1 Tax=Pseudovirgaria hyperparasitica TaxID=470096 RepID=A0A6A6W838_9PEZI|nr:uncharacterized protein EJ05DRAFT_529557 [Pseudovirgaria hyperparasitica]KAF2757747.1 hypothetical protein EJ05DRAFT_529557 [Pseudovirgaria hyperparasitica]